MLAMEALINLMPWLRWLVEESNRRWVRNLHSSDDGGRASDEGGMVSPINSCALNHQLIGT
jgi:hypothetical protein